MSAAYLMVGESENCYKNQVKVERKTNQNLIKIMIKYVCTPYVYKNVLIMLKNVNKCLIM